MGNVKLTLKQPESESLKRKLNSKPQALVGMEKGLPEDENGISSVNIENEIVDVMSQSA